LKTNFNGSSTEDVVCSKARREIVTTAATSMASRVDLARSKNS